MTLYRPSTLSLLFLLVIHPLVQADTEFGVHAYKRGHFDIAYREFKANAAADPIAQYYLGRIFERGEGTGRNTQRAIRWYLKAADAGYADAQYALGELFAHGEDTSKNYRESAKWLAKAAHNQHPDAALRLGEFYLSGRGVDKDPSMGITWLMEAKDAGSDYASEQLLMLQKQYPTTTFQQAEQQRLQLRIKGKGRHE